MRSQVLVLLLLILPACAVGPLVSNETARTLGPENHELVGGYSNSGVALKWSYGVNEELDIGLQWESLSIGLRAKYGLINGGEGGWSVAAALGAGTSVGGEHYYADLIASYYFTVWEPYTTFRIVRVKTDPVEFGSEDTGPIDFRISSVRYLYGQYMLGARYWLSPNWMISVEGSQLFSLSSGVSFGEAGIFGFALGHRF